MTRYSTRSKVRQPNTAQRAWTWALLLVAGTAFAAGAAAAERQLYLAEDGRALPFRSSEEIEQFLRSAPVVSSKLLGKGSTGVLKVTLDDGRARAHAVFRSIDQTFGRRNLGTRPDRFARRDSHLFEVAAYRIDRLLGLDRVPPTVRRTLGGREGSLQLWIENASTAAELAEEGRPAYQLTYHQQQIMRAFDVLVGNWDRHLNNELYDSKGRLWFIDHTRSFLLTPKLENLASLTSVEDRFLHALRRVNGASMHQALRGIVGRFEADAVTRRAAALLNHFDRLIEHRGENSVLFDLTQVAAAAQQHQDRAKDAQAFGAPSSGQIASSGDPRSRFSSVSIAWPSGNVQVLL